MSKYEPPKNYLQSLREFREHLQASANQLIDDIANGKDYDPKYSIQISVNGKSTTIELHADAYDRLLHMINQEIAEYIQLKGEVE